MLGVGASDEGPYYGWYVTLACFFGSFVVFGLSYSFGVFFDVILADFDQSRGGTSLVFSIHTFVLYLGAFAMGGVVDTYGARRPLIGAGVVLGIGLFWTSRAGSILELLVAYGLLVAVGLGVVFVVSYATVPRWFGRRRGRAAGIASAGLGVGMVVVAPAAGVSIDLVGWRATYLLLSGLVLVVLAIAIVLIVDDPVSAGVDTRDEFADQPIPDTVATDRLTDAFAIGLDRSFLFVFVGWVTIYATLYVVLVHLPAFAVDAGLSRQTGALALGVLGGASALARVVIGFLSDRVGRVRTFVVCSTAMGVATIALPLARTALAIGLFAVVYGVAYGGNGALLGPLIADLFGTSNINTVFGLMAVSFAVSGVLSPSLAGAGYDVLGTYHPAFVASGIAAVVGAGFVGLAGVREAAWGTAASS